MLPPSCPSPLALPRGTHLTLCLTPPSSSAPSSCARSRASPPAPNRESLALMPCLPCQRLCDLCQLLDWHRVQVSVSCADALLRGFELSCSPLASAGPAHKKANASQLPKATTLTMLMLLSSGIAPMAHPRSTSRSTRSTPGPNVSWWPALCKCDHSAIMQWQLIAIFYGMLGI